MADYLKSQFTVDESVVPYPQSAFTDPPTAPNPVLPSVPASATRRKVAAVSYPRGEVQLKNALLNGPVVAGITCYEDFQRYYTTGYYKPALDSIETSATALQLGGRLTLNSTNPTTSVGSVATVTATVDGQPVTINNLTVANTSVAVANGTTLRGVAVGTTSFTATANGESASGVLTVLSSLPSITGVTLSAPTTNITTGNSVQLSLTTQSSSGNVAVPWGGSSFSVTIAPNPITSGVDISSTGVLTADAGNHEVYVDYTSGGRSYRSNTLTFNVSQAPTASLNLWFSSGWGDFFSTASAQGNADAPSTGFTFVRTEGRVYTVPVPGTVPLKLYFNSSRLDNFSLVTAAAQSDAAKAAPTPYTFIRNEGYVYSSQKPGTVPLKLFFNSTRGDNFLTATAAGEAAASSQGYTFIRTEGYCLP